MILVAGIRDEGPTALVVEALEAIGANVRVFDQPRVTTAHFTLEIADDTGGGAIAGSITIDGETMPLAGISGLYLRVMDDRLASRHCVTAVRFCRTSALPHVHDLLQRFADMMPGRVLNRPADMASNHSKPYQAQGIAAAGFDIPDTVITNDPSEARSFIEQVWAEGRHVIYKSARQRIIDTPHARRASTHPRADRSRPGAKDALRGTLAPIQPAPRRHRIFGVRPRADTSASR